MVNLAVFFGLILLVEIGLHLLFLYSQDSRVKYFASVRQLTFNSQGPQYQPHRYLGYYPTPNWSKEENLHNSLGFRGEEIEAKKSDEEFRIVCIGGSTTYTTGVQDYKKSYPYLLQKELNQLGFKHVKVINSGVGNWSSWESLINFQLRLLDLDPDLLVVYHATNDIQARIVWPPEAYVGDNTARRKNAFGDLAPGWKDSFLEGSNILRILSILLEKKTSNIALEKLDPSPSTYFLPLFIKQLEEDIYPSGIFTEVPVATMIETNRPIYFKRNLENLVDLALINEINVVMSTFKHCAQFENEFSSSPEYALAYAEHNNIIKEIARSKKIPCLEFDKEFPDSKDLFKDGRHVNERGSALKAQIFGRFIGNYLMENDPDIK